MKPELIGKVLIEREVLTPAQVQQVLDRQDGRRDERPFGAIAEEAFGIDEQDVLEALAQQFATSSPTGDLARQRHDDRCLPIITPQEAWDALVLPLRLERGELVAATTHETLPQAIRLLQRAVFVPFKFIIVDVGPLERHIAQRYQFEGVEVAEV